MIKFFRHIRQKLLSENAFSKYLIYALGEIILVVIGILIALRINNKSEFNKVLQKEEKYLQSLKDEMQGNQASIEAEIRRLKLYIEGLQEFIAIKSNQRAITDGEFSSIWAKVFSQQRNFNFKNGVLSEVISSGGLKDIRNDSIRNLLASMSGKIEKLRKQENDVNSYTDKANDFLEKHGSFRRIIDDVNRSDEWGIGALSQNRSNLILLESDEFENVMVFAIATSHTLSTYYYAPFRTDMERLINLINKELESD